MARIVWKRRNLFVCSCFCLLTAIAMAIAVVSIKTLCNNQVSLKQLDELCGLYKDNRVTGDLCEALCVDKSLEFRNCLHINHGKVVLLLSWNGTFDVVMKSKHADLDSFFAFDFKKIGTDRLLPIPSPSLLREAISGLLKSRFGQDAINSSDLDLLDIQGSESDLKYRGRMLTKWLLFQQDEYLLMHHLRHNPNTPKLYGNCGHYYATEFLPPRKYLHDGNTELKVFPSSDWKRRADVAFQLMDTVQSFDEDFPSPLNFCDMKEANFGSDRRGNVKPLDVDMAVFEDFLKDFYRQSNCSRDSDCSFFDCNGWCMVDQRKCLPLRTNTNIQTLCENIFIGNLWRNFFVGLLSSPPVSISQELTQLLDRCRNPAVGRFREIIDYKCSPIRDSMHLLPFAETDECRKAIGNLKTFLTVESRNILQLLKEIVSRNLDT